MEFTIQGCKRPVTCDYCEPFTRKDNTYSHAAISSCLLTSLELLSISVANDSHVIENKQQHFNTGNQISYIHLTPYRALSELGKL